VSEVNVTETIFKPRPSQQKILDCCQQSGPLYVGVAAVPGSGKTHILAYLAAGLIPRVEDEQEVLIVTLVNAAVDNFRRRIDGLVRHQGFLPGFNYRVCTLHSLALEIVRQRPGLVGLTPDLLVADERTSQAVLGEVVQSWLSQNPDFPDHYLLPDLDDNATRQLQRRQVPNLVSEVALSFIKRAKDHRLTPHDLQERLEQYPYDLPLAKLGVDIYAEYQARLARTGSVDFDDLIRLAAQAIDLDPDLLARLRHQWPFILEDEAQDSSRLQEEILRTLAGASAPGDAADGASPSRLWIRVGDPNQAIYQTFTTANPENLRRFLEEDGVHFIPMPEAGRSSPGIINLANFLIDWTQTDHPSPAARDALAPPYIEPTPEGDPQPNPPDRPQGIHFPTDKFGPKREVEVVVRSVRRWLAENPERTVAVLVARNSKGIDVANALRRADVPYVELLASTSATRSTAGVLGNALQHLVSPTNPRQLATLFRAWQRYDWDREDLKPAFKQAEQALAGHPRPETYLWPRPGEDWLAGDEALAAVPGLLDTLARFREMVQRWHQAAAQSVPIDQLILLLAQDLFTDSASPADLALAHKFAVVLRQEGRQNPDWRLPQFTETLAEIARNQRRFLGFDEEDVGFEPPPGKVTVATMHKAKGLEWDRVYLVGVNNYNFPSGQAHDTYFSEKWFARDSLNLEAEALAQLGALETGQEYFEGDATHEARLALVQERLRLLYVGLTRARQELVATWNTGRQMREKAANQPAAPLIALQTYWNRRPGWENE
ncbi:MAG: ATP-dependent helicase, partial [Anaerolineae bacterium]